MSRFVSIRFLCLLVVCLAVLPAAWAATTAADQQFESAKRLLDMTLYQRAVGELQKFVATYPDDARTNDAHFMLGRCYQRQQLFEKALADYTLVLDNATAPVYLHLRAEAHFEMGECYLSQKDYKRAITAYGNCLKLTVKDEDLTARAQYWMAECQYQLGQYADAKKNYSQVSVSAPKHALTPWAIYSIGMIELRQANYDPAIAALEQVTTRYSDSEVASDATLMLGYAYARQADKSGDNLSATAKTANYHKAIDLFSSLLDGKATRTEKQHAALAMAEAYFALKDYPKAGDAYTRALEIIPPGSELAMDTRLRHAHTLYNSEQYSAAAADYGLVAEGKYPDLTLQALYWMGNSWYQLASKSKETKDYLEAISAFRRFATLAGEKHADAPRAALLVAFSLEDMATAGDASARPKAITAFQDIAAKWPTSREAMHARDGIDRLTANMTVEELRAASKAMPAEGAAWNMQLSLARKEFQDGRYAEAITAAGKVLDGNPSTDVMVQASYLIGACQQQAGHAEMAISYYKKALAGAPAGELAPYALRGLIQADMDARKYDEARDAALNLTALKLPEGDKAQAQMYLANAYSANQQYAESLATYQQLVKSYPTSPLVPGAYMGMAAVAEARKDNVEAVARYREVVAKFPDHEVAPRAFFHIGTNLLEQKPPEYTAAINAFKNIPPTHKLADQAAYAIAWAYADQGNIESANTQFELVAKTFPKSPLAADSLYRIGENGLMQKHYAEAEGYFRRAQELVKPGDLATLIAYKLGVSAFYTKDYEVAATAFDRVANTNPPSEYAVESQFMKAQSLDLHNQPQPARDAYVSYLAKYAAESYALDAAVGAGRCALALKLYPTARADLGKALDLYQEMKARGNMANPDRAKSLSAEAQYYLAECAYEEPNYVEAFKQFAAVPDTCEPWASRSLLQMARCTMLQTDTTDTKDTHRQEATAILQSLLHKYPTSDAAQQAQAVAKEYGVELKTDN